MRVLLVVFLVVGCEKAGGVETSSGSGSSTATAPVVVTPDASLATTPNDAAAIANAPADAAAPVDAAAPAPRRDTVAISEENAARIADLLTADSVSDSIVGDMSRRRPGADLGSMIEDVKDSGKQVVVGGGTGRGARSDGAARVSTGAGPKVDAPGAVDATGGRSDDTPRGRVTVSSKQAFDESTLTPDAVVGKILAAYMAGIKRCYKTYLRQDPAARGRIILSFTVNETGRAVNPKANGFVKEVDTCLDGMMSGWRFPIPKDRDGESTEASFSIGLQMVPD